MTIHLVDTKTKVTLCGYSFYPSRTPYSTPLPAGDHWIGMQHDTPHSTDTRDLLCPDCRAHHVAGTRQSPHYRPMSTAPTTERILLKHWNWHYRPLGDKTTKFFGSQWVRTPQPVWTEVHWVDKEEQTGSPAHWEEWTGNPAATALTTYPRTAASAGCLCPLRIK